MNGILKIIKSYIIAYDNIRKIAVGQGDDYTTGCLLHYNYFNNYCKIIAIDLRKQQEYDADPKSIQQINFTENLDRDGSTTMFFIIDEVNKNCFRFFTRNCESFLIYFVLI